MSQPHIGACPNEHSFSGTQFFVRAAPDFRAFGRNLVRAGYNTPKLLCLLADFELTTYGLISHFNLLLTLLSYLLTDILYEFLIKISIVKV